MLTVFDELLIVYFEAAEEDTKPDIKPEIKSEDNGPTQRPRLASESNDANSQSQTNHTPHAHQNSTDPVHPTMPATQRVETASEKVIRDLKTQLKKAVDQYKEMKLQLEMYKNEKKETRDRVQIMASEKKYRMECEELRKQLAGQHSRHLEVAGPDGKRRKLTEEEIGRKMQKMDEMVNNLQKQLASQKQEDEALLNEMEVTGNAYEDMQEQNLRLIQQLREKDDANFKLMSERIKSQQIQKLLMEEKNSHTEQVTVECAVSRLLMDRVSRLLRCKLKSKRRTKWSGSSKKRSVFSKTICQRLKKNSRLNRYVYATLSANGTDDDV